MYDEPFIEELKELIGFGEPLNLPANITVDAKHINGTSGRTFGYFHRFINLENLYQTIRKVSIDSQGFNDYLDQMKEDSVKAALDKLSELCGGDCRYKAEIEKSPHVLINIIGYNLAVTGIEEMITSSRINSDERNVVFKYDKLKVELEGLLHESGRIISMGLKAKRLNAINALHDRFCVEGIFIEDASNHW